MRAKSIRLPPLATIDHWLYGSRCSSLESLLFNLRKELVGKMAIEDRDRTIVDAIYFASDRHPINHTHLEGRR